MTKITIFFFAVATSIAYILNVTTLLHRSLNYVDSWNDDAGIAITDDDNDAFFDGNAGGISAATTNDILCPPGLLVLNDKKVITPYDLPSSSSTHNNPTIPPVVHIIGKCYKIPL